MGAHACNPHPGAILTGRPWDCPVCLAYMVGSRQVRDPIFNKNTKTKWMPSKESHTRLSCSLHAHSHTSVRAHTHTYTHILMHAPATKPNLKKQNKTGRSSSRYLLKAEHQGKSTYSQPPNFLPEVLMLLRCSKDQGKPHWHRGHREPGGTVGGLPGCAS